jgi:hypothetical protein
MRRRSDGKVAARRFLRHILRFCVRFFRVLISLGLLGGGKVLNVCVPFLFKAAVDNLGALSMETVPEAAVAATASIIIGCKLRCWNKIAEIS